MHLKIRLHRNPSLHRFCAGKLERFVWNIFYLGLVLEFCVMYFNEHLASGHSKPWLKYVFSYFGAKKWNKQWYYCWEWQMKGSLGIKFYFVFFQTLDLISFGAFLNNYDFTRHKRKTAELRFFSTYGMKNQYGKKKYQWRLFLLWLFTPYWPMFFSDCQFCGDAKHIWLGSKSLLQFLCMVWQNQSRTVSGPISYLAGCRCWR